MWDKYLICANGSSLVHEGILLRENAGAKYVVH